MTVKNRANEVPKFKPRGTPFRVAPIRKGDIHPRTNRKCKGITECGEPIWGEVDQPEGKKTHA